jgi:mono/diheme cytochrome c family protein
MYRTAIRSLFAATTALLLLATAACDKPEEKKAEKKAEDKKAEEVKAVEPPPVEPPPVEPPPVEPPVEPPPVDPPADTGAAADAGEPAADGGAEKAEPKPEPKPEPKSEPEPTAAKIDGKAIFDAKCDSCHGADGKGDTTIGKKVNIPSLAGTKLSKSKIIATTESGVPDTKMKGFKDKLTADEIAAVATYVGKL